MKIEGSSQVAELDYDSTKKILTVTYHGEAKYDYQPVTPTQNQQLLHAKSKGSYLAQNIKNNKKIICTKRQDAGTLASMKAASVAVPKKQKQEAETRTITELSRDFHKLIRESR
jgi:hypothetical protein